MKKGFTLIELLVVIAILGILASGIIVIINPAEQFAKTRDAGRKSALGSMAGALDRYFVTNGAYPSTGGGWWGEPSGYGSHTTDYIPSLVASGELEKLPNDPKAGKSYSPCGNGSATGYLYNSPTGGACYKLLAHCSPESKTAFAVTSPPNPFIDPQRPTYTWMVCKPLGSTCCSY